MWRWLSWGAEKKSKEELKLIRFIIKKFGYRPVNLELFKTALTHKSVSNFSEDQQSNERLEFLGDTILDAIVAEYLYVKFPNKDEGYLTKVKSKIVSRSTLSSIAEQISIHQHIQFQKGRAIRISTIEGNAFEALIGAIYLDSDFETTKKIVCNHIFRLHLDLTQLLEQEIDFKSRLFMWSQKNKLTVAFEFIKEEHNNGVWEYEAEVRINNRPYGKGAGESKKAAEQAASRETLALMGEI